MFAQNETYDVSGKVSYISAQNIYVRFDGSNNIQLGDTLFVLRNQQYQALFVVESRSSLSCMGVPMGEIDIPVGEEVFAQTKIDLRLQEESETINQPIVDGVQVDPKHANKDLVTNTEPEFKQKIKGRISMSSYSNFSDNTDSNHRMRYRFSMQVEHINDSRFTADTYLAFSHRNGEWDAVKENIFHALKVYSLAVKYQVGDQANVWLGRKINPNLSNIGAIDGLQAEMKLKNFKLGAAVGARPDYKDYSFNADLFEYGIYMAHELSSEKGIMSNSLAFFEQKNNGMVDRRFIYFQHSNTLLHDLFLFVSSELDLYTLENELPQNTMSLTGLYISLRYRIIKQLSVYASYDARKNVIYYETFKNIVDRLLEEATRQGAHLRVNYRPGKKLNVGLNASYRTRDDDVKPTKTLNGFASYTNIPRINATVTTSANILQTSYMDGKIFGLKFYKDIAKGKLYSSLGYRYVDYDFNNSAGELLQHIAELDLTWRINRKFSFSANYEGAFEKSNMNNMLYISLIKRF